MLELKGRTERPPKGREPLKVQLKRAALRHTCDMLSPSPSPKSGETDKEASALPVLSIEKTPPRLQQRLFTCQKLQNFYVTE